MVISKIGQDLWDRLEQESNRIEKTDMEAVKVYLEEVERGLKEKNDGNC